ncbi:MAG: MetS family NSS transporter small subunit [Planctomycetota bacterium]
MTTANIVYMVVVLGLVWGGFAYCLFLLATNRDTPNSETDEQTP